jgi:hypothetical protein
VVSSLHGVSFETANDEAIAKRLCVGSEKIVPDLPS